MSGRPGSKRGLRTTLIVLGCCCIIAAAALGTYNYLDEQRANQLSGDLTQQISLMLEKTEAPSDAPRDNELDSLPSNSAAGPSALSVGVYDVCGILAIPAIDVQLAIIRDWSYPNLAVSACRYSGEPENQMILLAHNYRGHFADLDDLKPGDAVSFTDADGTEYQYEVTGTEIWATNQLREIISGDSWDLTLFTCTYGGNSRVVVRCVRV